MLKLDNVKTFYGNIRALKGISLEVNQGEIVCLIGANGAGKSTTLMTISGVLNPLEGSITYRDKDITGAPPDRIVQGGICQVPEGRMIFPVLTVQENLELGAYLRSDKEGIEADLEKCYGIFPRLKERRKQFGGTLSGGEQQMLAIARALMGRPQLLMLDEPSLGLAPIVVEAIFRTIKEINDEGMTILLVEQNASMALEYSHRGYVLETGLITMSDTAKDLACNEEVAKAYLGH
jgi:branched-chain amino acid transport system ATP-binding protein